MSQPLHITPSPIATPASTQASTPLSQTSSPRPGTSALQQTPVTPGRPTKEKDHIERSLENIRTFLESKTCYEILPESFRLIVFDNKLSITRSLQALVTNGVVSAPLYDSTTQRFAGMFTLADVVHLIQYYYLTSHEYENVVAEVEAFQLGSLRQIEQAIDVPPPPTAFVHPEQPLADACAALVRTHARRLPLVDVDEQTGKETIVSVLTQYRVLKFIAINCQHDCARLDQSIGSLGIGSYCSFYNASGIASTSNTAPSSAVATPSLGASTASPSFSPASHSLHLPSAVAASLSSTPASTPASPFGPGGPGSRTRSRSVSQANVSRGDGVNTDKYFPLVTATMQTSVFDVVHSFSERGISAVPIVDEDGVVINLYETVDIVDLVRQNAYQVLDKTIEVALSQRASDFTGVISCTPNDTLASILAYIRERRCHRFVIVEGEDSKSGRKKGSLVGILSLSDVMRFIVGHEDLKGHEVPGLGVHGLRSVSRSSDDKTTSGGHPETDFDTDVADTASLASKGGSRRGSGASIVSGMEQHSLVAVGEPAVPDVVEGEVLGN